MELCLTWKILEVNNHSELLALCTTRPGACFYGQRMGFEAKICSWACFCYQEWNSINQIGWKKMYWWTVVVITIMNRCPTEVIHQNKTMTHVPVELMVHVQRWKDGGITQAQIHECLTFGGLPWKHNDKRHHLTLRNFKWRSTVL